MRIKFSTNWISSISADVLNINYLEYAAIILTNTEYEKPINTFYSLNLLFENLLKNIHVKYI